MIILDGRKFIETKFINEQEIEDLVVKYSEYFFGPSSIFVPKKKIKTFDGFSTIPDGFAIDLASRSWYLVEAELGHHSLWNHIAPQITKQLTSISREETAQLISELVVNMVNNDKLVLAKFNEEGIKPIDIRRVLGEILQKIPIVGIPIDSISKDLEQWAKTLRNDVRIWIIKKFLDIENPEIIAYQIPEEYRPTLEIIESENGEKRRIKTYEVTISDLINKSLLHKGQELLLQYGPGGANRRNFRAVINHDGSLAIDGNSFSSPSYAALHCIRSAGSNRETVNGWTSWKCENGEFLTQVRERYLSLYSEDTWDE